MTELPAILHADVDAFFASVAQRDDPALRGRPVVVGSWVVMAASYEARAYGVKGGMSGAQARRLCPGLVTVDPSFPSYVEASRAVFGVFRREAPVVEPGSMEEAFLDLRGGDGGVGGAGAGAGGRSGVEVAERLRRAVRDEVGLPLSVGVARTKVLAKLASRAAKPDGLFVVEPARELAFLHPLPVGKLWGVGPSTAEKLREFGLETVGQVAQLTEEQVVTILGRAAGRYVHAVASGRDPRPVRARRGRRSFGAQRALGRSRPRDAEALDEALAGLAERLAQRMGKSGREGRTVVLRLRFGDYTRATRSRTLARATAAPEELLAAARALLAGALPAIEARGITLVGLTVTNLAAPGGGEQLTLGLDLGEDGAEVAL